MALAAEPRNLGGEVHRDANSRAILDERPERLRRRRSTRDMGGDAGLDTARSPDQAPALVAGRA